MCGAESEPRAQACGHIAQRRPAQPAGEVLEVHVEVAGSETFEITAVLLQVSQEGHNLAAPDATRLCRLPPGLALLLDESLKSLCIAPWG